MNIIIPEERLIEVFATLPERPGMEGDTPLTPKFEFGTQKDLLVYLNDETKLKEYPYPLVFAETPILGIGGETYKDVKGLTIIVAHRSKAGFTPRERLQGTIKYRIRPTVEDVLTALKDSGVTVLTNKEKIAMDVWYNYGSTPEEKEHIATDIWDAIRFKVDVQFTTKCLRPIIYKL